MAYRKYCTSLVFFILIIIGQYSSAQNIISNYDFSTASVCPTKMSMLDSLVDWHENNGSPDYFDLCGTGYGGAPNHPWGYQNPYSGTGFVNFLKNESFIQYLDTTIKYGDNVYYEYYVSRGENGKNAAYGFGLQFQNGGSLVHTEVYTDTLLDTINWVKVSGCFIAPGDINEIVAGGITGTTGYYEVAPSNTFSGGYTYFDNLIVTINTNTLLIDIGGDTSLCEGDSLILSTGNPDADHVWSTGDITEFITVNTANTYFVDLTLGACTGTDTIMVDYLDAVDPELGNDTALCGTATLMLDVNTIGDSYVWSTGEITSNIQISGQGTYWVEVTDDNCTGSDTIIVQYLTAITADIGNDTTICESESLLLSANYPGEEYIWSNGDSTQSIEVNSEGTYWVYIKSNGCNAYDTVSVFVNNNPKIELGGEKFICDGQQLQLSAGSNNYSYLWYPNGEASESITVNEEGMYSVTAEDSVGCIAVDSIQVTELCASALYVPNTFTPDNDGLNEEFKPSIENINDYELRIFNRWGNLLFETTDINKGWDGTYGGNNRICPDGTYIWQITYAGVNTVGQSYTDSELGYLSLFR